MKPIHHPVMLAESLRYLGATGDESAETQLFIDATLGLGGHTEAILQASPHHRVIAFDRDAEAIQLARDRLAEFADRFEAVHADYRDIRQVLIDKQIGAVRGILADLGISSFQLDTAERGFSFRAEADSPSAPLDMRMDRSQKLTAAEVVNEFSERELADIIFEFGEERAARRIARQIVLSRAKAPLTTTAQLADLVVRVVHPKGRWRIHPATQTFQALRIAVNRELDNLDQFVADAVDLLETDGRLVFITFHSLEDRIIKRALKYQNGQCVCPPGLPDCQCKAVRRVELLTRKAVPPSEAEISANPRSRSAKLRACRKL